MRPAGAARSLALALGGLLALAPRVALAHRLELDVREAGGEVVVEAFFSDGTPCEGARVVARLRGGERILAEGATDARGALRFPAPPAGTAIEVEARDAGGHLARATLELGGGGAAPSPPRPHGAVPWARVALGLCIIALLSAALAAVKRWPGRRP